MGLLLLYVLILQIHLSSSKLISTSIVLRVLPLRCFPSPPESSYAFPLSSALNRVYLKGSGLAVTSVLTNGHEDPNRIAKALFTNVDVRSKDDLRRCERTRRPGGEEVRALMIEVDGVFVDNLWRDELVDTECAVEALLQVLPKEAMGGLGTRLNAFARTRFEDVSKEEIAPNRLAFEIFKSQHQSGVSVYIVDEERVVVDLMRLTTWFSLDPLTFPAPQVLSFELHELDLDLESPPKYVRILHDFKPVVCSEGGDLFCELEAFKKAIDKWLMTDDMYEKICVRGLKNIRGGAAGTLQEEEEDDDEEEEEKIEKAQMSPLHGSSDDSVLPSTTTNFNSPATLAIVDDGESHAAAMDKIMPETKKPKMKKPIKKTLKKSNLNVEDVDVDDDDDFFRGLLVGFIISGTIFGLLCRRGTTNASSGLPASFSLATTPDDEERKIRLNADSTLLDSTNSPAVPTWSLENHLLQAAEFEMKHASSLSTGLPSNSKDMLTRTLQKQDQITHIPRPKKLQKPW